MIKEADKASILRKVRKALGYKALPKGGHSTAAQVLGGLGGATAGAGLGGLSGGAAGMLLAGKNRSGGLIEGFQTGVARLLLGGAGAAGGGLIGGGVGGVLGAKAGKNLSTAARKGARSEARLHNMKQLAKHTAIGGGGLAGIAALRGGKDKKAGVVSGIKRILGGLKRKRVIHVGAGAKNKVRGMKHIPNSKDWGPHHTASGPKPKRFKLTDKDRRNVELAKSRGRLKQPSLLAEGRGGKGFKSKGAKGTSKNPWAWKQTK